MRKSTLIKFYLNFAVTNLRDYVYVFHFQVPQEKTSNTEDGEEQLDFEAEEGECIEPKAVEQPNGDAEDKGNDKGENFKFKKNLQYCPKWSQMQR